LIDRVLSDGLICKLNWDDKPQLVADIVHTKMNKLGVEFDKVAFEVFLEYKTDIMKIKNETESVVNVVHNWLSKNTSS
jgi:hypothetical protein